MAMTDPIADMLSRIRNANSVFHDKVEIPGSKIKIAIADVLKNEGFIKDYSFTDDNKQGILTVKLKYGSDRQRVITGIKRISRPGLRHYSKKKRPPRVLSGLIHLRLSLPRGASGCKSRSVAKHHQPRFCFQW